MDTGSLYSFLKTLHVGAVAASGALFALRAGWMLRRPEMLSRRWVRVVPHGVDTVLLAAALGLLAVLQLNPFTTPWLAAKLLALVGYIVAWSVALKRGRTRGVRIAALGLAGALFAYMVGTALTRNPAFFIPS
jgi:uncharacterized membrane protein SirB2